MKEKNLDLHDSRRCYFRKGQLIIIRIFHYVGIFKKKICLDANLQSESDASLLVQDFTADMKYEVIFSLIEKYLKCFLIRLHLHNNTLMVS